MFLLNGKICLLMFMWLFDNVNVMVYVYVRVLLFCDYVLKMGGILVWDCGSMDFIVFVLLKMIES